MNLLERDHCFEQLSILYRTATTGNGRTVLVSGEAGIGKTALVEQFVSLHCRAVRRLWGACEALFTPRPLGPLYDIAAQVHGSLSTLMSRDTPRPMVFSALLDELQKSASPTVVVIEDVHWADEATLDLIKFLGRRISSLAVLFIVTYRDDALSRDHPLWSVIGDLPGKAVTHLAHQRHQSVEQLYTITGGNPFFVTEVLASDTPGIPMTVRDAVLARVARLSPAARPLLELASIVPGRTERWLLEAVLGAATSALEECLTSSMLSLDQTTVAFRHELARQAVESTLSLLRKPALHAQVLQALLNHGEDTSQAARLVHHAAGAHDEALALADGDAHTKLSALAFFEQLSAQPALALVRQRMREQGMQGIPRGPRPSTRTNQAGLTTRQLEVLRLMSEGLPNAEIASRLSTSLKTVDHHVSAVLAKLGAHSRAQAISSAYQLGIIPKMGNPHA